MVIVHARPAHLAAVQACVDAAYHHYVERIDKPPAPMLDDYEHLISQGVVHVAMQGEQIVGVIVMWDEDEYFYVDNIAVDPSVQGRGVGSQLLAEADRAARAARRSEIRLYTNAAMTENLDYYARQGFVETHRGRDGDFRRVYFTRPVD
jgi:ribosomal protein S18 acetylase RimI-like enzyme